MHDAHQEFGDDEFIYLLYNWILSKEMDYDENTHHICKITRDFPYITKYKAVNDFIELVTIMDFCLNNPEKLSARLINLIVREPYFAFLIHDMFYHLNKKTELGKLLNMFKQLNIASPEIYNYFELLKCRLLFKTGEFDLALYIMERMKDSAFLKLGYDEQLEFINLSGKLYWQTGQHGRAILTCQELLPERNENAMPFNDCYVESMMRLAIAYSRYGRYNDAKKLIVVHKFYLICIINHCCPIKIKEKGV